MEIIKNPSNLPLQNLSDVWKERHDLKVTRETIKQILKDGIPAWYKWPKDYKAFAQETYLADREVSNKMAARFRMDDQELLINEVARRVNPIATREFIYKLRKAGVKCYTIDLGFPPQTVGLWAFKPGSDRVIPIAYCQVPAMVEWSVLRLDHRGLPNGEAFRGWRTVLSQLILKGIISEQKAHEIFGRPVDGPVSRRYRKTLFYFRNRRQLTHDATLSDSD
jgi:hypothetical protein